MTPLNEPYRPQYHFTPPAKWMNDPNGLVYFRGEYHLFYQHNPDDTIWGPMHWGHALSRDLVNWQHLPIALYPDEIGTIFSGSAVIDWQDTAGFGAEAMIALFTHDTPAKQQHQSLAYSTDNGRTWDKYAGNPIIEMPNNLRNFRDPKVFWYAQGENSGHWVMLLVAGSAVLFYTSPDLIHWEPVSGFGFGYGATRGVWETPDIFQLPIEGSSQTRWVLTVGIGDGSPAGGSGTQYFIGDFDGQTFTSENPKDTVLWVDYGADFYAAQSWSNFPDERRIWIGWMSNWSYANELPTSTWRSALSIPREVGLVAAPEGVRLIQRPINKLKSLRGIRHTWRDETLYPGENLLADIHGETLEIIAEFLVDQNLEADRLGIRVRSGITETTTIGYEVKAQTLFVDRSQSGQSDFHPGFAKIHAAKMKSQDGVIRLHIFVDRSSVEIFGNDGWVVFTEQIFPAAESLALEIFADGGEVALEQLEIYQLNAAKFTCPSVQT